MSVVKFRIFGQLGSNSIENPPGGLTAASPIWSMSLGGLPCIKGLHVQDSILGMNVGELSCI